MHVRVAPRKIVRLGTSYAIILPKTLFLQTARRLGITREQIENGTVLVGFVDEQVLREDRWRVKRMIIYLEWVEDVFPEKTGGGENG